MNGTKKEFVEQIVKRTKQIALDTIELSKLLPNNDEGRIIKRQIIRSATSVGANYRAVCRARSNREFFAKLSITVEEADETLYWLEIIEESGMVKNKQTSELMIEVTEVLAILARARKNTK